MRYPHYQPTVIMAKVLRSKYARCIRSAVCTHPRPCTKRIGLSGISFVHLSNFNPRNELRTLSSFLMMRFYPTDYPIKINIKSFLHRTMDLGQWRQTFEMQNEKGDNSTTIDSDPAPHSLSSQTRPTHTIAL